MVIDFILNHVYFARARYRWSINSNFEIIFSRYSSDGITSIIYIKKCINYIIGTSTWDVQFVMYCGRCAEVSKYRGLEQLAWLTHYWSFIIWTIQNDILYIPTIFYNILCCREYIISGLRKYKTSRWDETFVKIEAIWMIFLKYKYNNLNSYIFL